MGSVRAYARDKWDQTKDWVRRRLAQDDPLYRHPEQAVKLYSQGSEKMSPEIRTERYNDLKAQVAYYYAKQKRDVPQKWVAKIAAIDKDYNRLKTLDDARAVLQQHGPITKATIARDLAASKQYRVEAGIDAPVKERHHQIEFTPLKGHIASREVEKTNNANGLSAASKEPKTPRKEKEHSASIA